jgi:hypothetical protein
VLLIYILQTFAVQSVYMYFANENRDKLRSERPGISPGKFIFAMYIQSCAYISSGIIGVLLGKRWNSFCDRQRQPYKDKAKADKERYEDWHERKMGRMVAMRVYAAAIHAREN